MEIEKASNMYKKYIIEYNTRKETVRLFANNEKEIMEIYNKHKYEEHLGYFRIYEIKSVGFVDSIKEVIIW